MASTDLLSPVEQRIKIVWPEVLEWKATQNFTVERDTDDELVAIVVMLVATVAWNALDHPSISMTVVAAAIMHIVQAVTMETVIVAMCVGAVPAAATAATQMDARLSYSFFLL